MKTRSKILWAFILNLTFSVFEFVGGIFTGSVSILSDSVHDLGDAVSIGCSYFLEKKSESAPNGEYTYGYARFSTLGALISQCVLLVGGLFTVFKAVGRIISGGEVNEGGMIVLALVGLCVNLLAALFTAKGSSSNQRAVYLHMLEDVLGWAVVLIGAVVIRLTHFYLIDPIMSLAVSCFIIFVSAKSLKETLEIFLEKAPKSISADAITEALKQGGEVKDVHHIHIWSLDGEYTLATMHLVVNGCEESAKAEVRSILGKMGIHHATLELEKEGELCAYKVCSPKHNHAKDHCAHSHHHHHHH